MDNLINRTSTLPDRSVKGKILIAEDNDTIKKLLTKLLTSNGYEVEAVDDGLKAKKKLIAQNFDMVLTDILMPGIDGIELLKEVRENFGDIPVILITGNQSLENARKAIRWGAFDYITKPFNDLSAILHSVHRAIMKGKLQKDKENLISELDRKNLNLKSVVRELDRKNARLDMMVEDLRWAMQLGSIMTRETNINNIARNMTRGIFEIFDVSAWGVLVNTEELKSRVLLFKTRKKLEDDDDKLLNMVFSDYRRMLGITLDRGNVQLMIEENVLVESRVFQEQYHSIPLKMGEKKLGLLFVLAHLKEGFEDTKLKTLSLIANQMSAAVENASLFERLTKRNKELKELSEFKDEILGIAAHDLRSPISAIHMSAALLNDFADKMSEKEKKEAIEGIVKKANHMITMLNEMLDISVIESGNLVLKRKKVKFDEIVREHYQQAVPLARSKNIKIEYDVPEDLPTVYVDGDKIGEVIDNLLTNAIKYTPSGGKISLKAVQTDHSLEVCVADNGVGIKEKELDKLFKKFSRTSSRPTAGETSTGLGLAIAKRIVDMHRGKIWAESEYGKGSKFHFTIPVNLQEEGGNEGSEEKVFTENTR